MKRIITSLLVSMLLVLVVTNGQQASAALSASEKKTISQMQKQIGILSARVGELERQIGTADGTYFVDVVNYLSSTSCGTGAQVGQLSGSFVLGDKRFFLCQFNYNYTSR